MDAGEDESSGISDRFVVGASESDCKGVGCESTFAIGDAVVDGDGLGVVSGE